VPLTVPKLDQRTYQDLFAEAVARIPVHTPEWTNYNKSDPGITILGVMAFLTESLLYRCNQIPERNRRKFLSLLGVPLAPATAASGLVSFSNDRGPLEVFSLTPDLEVDAGAVPFRTEAGVDVLPIEVRAYFKQPVANPDPAILDYYTQLYASYFDQAATDLAPSLYQLASLGAGGASSVDLSQDTIDASVWLAILARDVDKDLDAVRAKIGQKTLSLGFVPGVPVSGVERGPGQVTTTDLGSVLAFTIPAVGDGTLPPDRTPSYRRLDATPSGDVLSQPGIVEIALPPADQLAYWQDLQPLEPGAGQFPPSLDDTTLQTRLITWIRVQAISPTDVDVVSLSANSAMVTQRTHVSGEVLPDGTGQPDQVVTLAHAPFLPASVVLTVTSATGTTETWDPIDDIMAAGPEVPAPDPKYPPGASVPVDLPTSVFVEDRRRGR
jgi:hypothetical protein